MTTIASRLQAVNTRISEAARAAGRVPGEITLVAVSKTFPAEAIAEACAAGQNAFGENYAQEGVAKIVVLDDLLGRRPESPRLTWHYIGPVQSNKTRVIAEHFDWVHGIDRAKIAERLSASRPDEKPPLQVCIQVNVSGEASKSGVAPEAVLGLAHTLMRLPRLRLQGLMAIPEPSPDTGLQRRRFRMLREIRDQLLQRGLAVNTLSMGMSDDLEAAIAEGATLVRVGRAIFGERNTGTT